MKLLIQRVASSSVTVNNQLISSINKGLLVFIGVSSTDDGSEIEWLVNKLLNLRVFEDVSGKMNLSVNDLDLDVMIISQFTLYADCKKGRRPDFTHAAKPEIAEELYNKFLEDVTNKYKAPKTGIFGADMKISLLNDGPVTIILEK